MCRYFWDARAYAKQIINFSWPRVAPQHFTLLNFIKELNSL